MADVRLTATNPADSSVVPVACNEKGELLLEDPIYVEGPPGPPGDPGDPFTGSFAGDVHLDGPVSINASSIDHPLTEKTHLVAAAHPDDAYTAWLTAPAGLPSRACTVFFTSTNDQAGLSNAGSLTFQHDVEGGVHSTELHIGLRNTGDGLEALTRVASFRARGQVGILKADPQAALDVNGDVIIGSRGTQWMIVESNGLAHLVDQSTVQTEGGYAVGENEWVEQSVVYPELRNIPDELTMVERQLQAVMERLKMAPEAGWEVWDGSE